MAGGDIGPLVLRQIHNQQQPIGAQHPGGLGNRGGGFLGIVQHHLHGRDILAGICQRQAVHIRLPHGAVIGDAALGQARAGQGQHFAAGIQPQRMLGALGQQFQQAAGAGADIHQLANPLGQRGGDGLLDLPRRQVERPQLIPIRAIAAEGLRGGTGTLGGDARGLPPVGRQLRIAFRQAAQQLPHQRGRGWHLEIGIGPLRNALQQPGLDQQFQVPRQSGLGLPQHIA